MYLLPMAKVKPLTPDFCHLRRERTIAPFNGKSPRFGVWKNWVHILAVWPWVSHLIFLEPQFSHLWNGDNTQMTVYTWWAQRLAHNRCLVHTSSFFSVLPTFNLCLWVVPHSPCPGKVTVTLPVPSLQGWSYKKTKEPWYMQYNYRVLRFSHL